ncbi:hypothetical protein NDU88_011804 [Pleurodeles waltl]|uniref:Uncharacterized protein n=1 Tax=Pleurodeles waltl TaxID=8319 RepID=A0AAV7R455_PLEWA|nr:hypothetical protein NDU88_011804 [Pleurodeles waltl]
MKEHRLKTPTKPKGNGVSKPCGNELVNEATKKPNSLRPSARDASTTYTAKLASEVPSRRTERPSQRNRACLHVRGRSEERVAQR